RSPSPRRPPFAAGVPLPSPVARRRPGQTASPFLPADTAWNPADGIAETAPSPARPLVDEAAVAAAAAMLRAGEPATLLLGGDALSQRCLVLAGKISAKTGCGLLSVRDSGRLGRGRDRVQVPRIHYAVDTALAG